MHGHPRSVTRLMAPLEPTSKDDRTKMSDFLASTTLHQTILREPLEYGPIFNLLWTTSLNPKMENPQW